MAEVFQVFIPNEIKAPIVLSIPHVGTAFPTDIEQDYQPALLPPDDTDWFVDQLYAFAETLGIVMIKAHYSRWVIDLNRNPDNQPLYNDGRRITGLCPVTNFLGESIYRDNRKMVDENEISRRRTLYFEPYHQQLQKLLDEVKQQFGKVLLWDCHSIRRHVPSINAAPFPDLILGSADETSADKSIIDTALQQLNSGRYKIAHNHPFKGGFITRHFGKPHLQQHALQLEMCKDLYMDDSETKYDENQAAQMQMLLKTTLQKLAEDLMK